MPARQSLDVFEVQPELFRNHKNLLDCKFSNDYLSRDRLNFLLGRIVNDKRFHTKCVYDGLTGSQINSVGLVKAAQTISSGERPTFQNIDLEYFYKTITPLICQTSLTVRSFQSSPACPKVIPMNPSGRVDQKKNVNNRSITHLIINFEMIIR